MRLLFDPSKYVTEIGDRGIQGHRLLSQAQQAATQAMREDFEAAAQRRQRAKEFEAQLAQRSAAQQALGQRFDAKLGLARDQFEAGRADKMDDRMLAQRKLDADAAAELVGPLSAGNLNDLERARAGAQARDPSLQVLLPGEKAPAVGPTPSVDDVYPDEQALDSVRMSRGGQALYQSPTAKDARRREAEITSRLVAPFAGSPWGEMGVDAAGAGIRGDKAAEIAMSGYEKQEGRDSAERAAGARLQAQREMAALRQEQREGDPLKLHDRIRSIAKDYLPQVQKINEEARQLSLAEGQLMQDANGFMQNKAMAGILKAYTGAAATESERAGDKQGAGMWNYYDSLIGKWANGGQLPPDFQKQVLEMLGHARQHSDGLRHKLGMQAANSVEASTNLPFRSARQLAEAKSQAYSELVGRGLSNKELDEEAARLEAAYPGRFGSAARAPAPRGNVPNGYDEATMQGGSGAAGNLGVTNGGATLRPSVRGQPVAPPPGGDLDSELDDLLRQMEEDQ